MSYESAAFLLRLMAAVVWTGVLVLILTGRWHSTMLRRSLVTASLVVTLWAVAFGGAVSLGIVPGDMARIIYTGVATVCLIVGILMLLDHAE